MMEKKRSQQEEEKKWDRSQQEKKKKESPFFPHSLSTRVSRDFSLSLLLLKMVNWITSFLLLNCCLKIHKTQNLDVCVIRWDTIKLIPTNLSTNQVRNSNRRRTTCCVLNTHLYRRMREREIQIATTNINCTINKRIGAPTHSVRKGRIAPPSI